MTEPIHLGDDAGDTPTRRASAPGRRARHGRAAARAPDQSPPPRTPASPTAPAPGGAAGAHDRARPRPVPAAPPHERRAVRPAAASSGPERLRLEDVSIAYGAKPAVKSVSLSIHQGEVLALIGPSGCGKTTLLRTLNRLTELTPSAARAGHILLDGEDIHELARHEPALARGDGLPAAQPVPDVDLRQRRLRAARTVAQAPRPQGARAAGDRRAAARRPLRRGPGRPRPPRPAPLRRPAAAPVHRARDRPPPRGAADGRALQRARPDLHEHDREADRRAAPRPGGRGRHPQPRPGAADRRQGRVHVPRRPRRVRRDRGGLRAAPRGTARANTSRAPSARRPAWRT